MNKKISNIVFFLTSFLILFFSGNSIQFQNKYDVHKAKDTIKKYKVNEYNHLKSKFFIGLKSFSAYRVQMIHGQETYKYRGTLQVFKKNGEFDTEIFDTGTITLRWDGEKWLFIKDTNDGALAKLK
jgi:hypothetical protein